MKKTILSIIILIMIYNYSYSQNWQWSKKTSSLNPSKERGIITNPSGNVYIYGSGSFENHWFSTTIFTDTVGSYLNCFNSSGDLLFTKRWPVSFYITKMVCDQQNALYFSATFYGTHTINGITISSEGDSDGAVGKMDMNGNIVWISTFGGSGVDRCMGIAFNPADMSVYATGRIKNSLSIDHVFKNTGEQSAIVCRYSKRGECLKNKRYDFVPGRDTWEANSGLEIACNRNGDLFILMDRDGQHPMGGDTISGPFMGRYIMKLNAALDTTWTRHIIGPECYYGYSCNSLKVSAAGDAYVSRKCNGKYGGHADLL